MRAVKDELRITSSTEDDVFIRRQINIVSQQVEDFLGRPLGYNAARVDTVPGYGGNRIMVSLRPVLSLTTVEVVDGGAVFADYDVDGIEIEDADAGWLYRSAGFPWTVPRPSGSVSRHALPGHEQRAIRVTYAGGYVLPNEVNPTLPPSIEGAVIIAVAHLYLQRGRDRSIQSERLMSYSVTYGSGRNSTATTARMFPSSPFPDEATSMLMPYRDLAQA